MVLYYDSEVDVLLSAFRHGVDVEEIAHALRNAVVVEEIAEDPPATWCSDPMPPADYSNWSSWTARKAQP